MIALTIDLGTERGFGHRRPQTRKGCQQVPRPCPYVGCKYNLYLDVNPATGTIKLNFPQLEPHEMRESCALDLAEQGGLNKKEVGKVLNLSRERIRQIQDEAVGKLRDKILELPQVRTPLEQAPSAEVA